MIEGKEMNYSRSKEHSESKESGACLLSPTVSTDIGLSMETQSEHNCSAKQLITCPSCSSKNVHKEKHRLKYQLY